MIKKINLYRLLLIIGLLQFSDLQARSIHLKGNITIYTSAKENEPLAIAVKALQRDIKKVTGFETNLKPLSTIGKTGIVILDDSKDHKFGATVAGWEAHRIYTNKINNQKQIVLEGADTRGAIYAIYTFSEKILGVPPLWYFSSWKPKKKAEIKINDNFDINIKSPEVKYRAWFPNDTDLFEPWRKLTEDHYELWLETAMRLKLNTIEWFDDERDYANPYSVSRTTKLINNYGLVNTTHHHSPLNASFAGWKDYWKKVKHVNPPELSLANMDKLEEFWRYNIESVVKNKINMLWVLGFRGNGDHPFWYTFKDAPQSEKERGAVISDVLEKQRKIVMDVTKDTSTKFRTIFYDELSDLIAKGYISPPNDSSFIWTYVATRRDHYPNKDIQKLDKSKNLSLGYYFNYQFTSTGSHLAAAEGPWKMEKNFRYVASKSNKPMAFSVVNAGNLREHLMELSANATMMWDFKSYKTTQFLKDYSTLYFGKKHSSEIADLYSAFYNAYWQQRKPDMDNFDRQYVFQDLRYNKAIKDICTNFHKPYNPNPLIEIGAEQVENRTFNIVPEDNEAETVIDAIINGTTSSNQKFLKVTKQADAIFNKLDINNKDFFNDNLRQPAYYMYHLNISLLKLSKAYKAKEDKTRKMLAKEALAALHDAEQSLLSTQHNEFSNWYSGDRVFGFKNLYNKLNDVINNP
jgi:hypothetical protein